jgi:AAA domain
MAQTRPPHNAPTTALRLQLLANGCAPLPATVDKEVLLPGWSKRQIDEKEVRSWERRLKEWPSTGNRCTYQPCLDLDIQYEEAADACEQLVRDGFGDQGELLIRIGYAPKRLIPFRTETPFKKRLLKYRAPNGDPHKVEFLADGQQAVFYGYHNGAKRDYQWRADRDPLKVPGNFRSRSRPATDRYRPVVGRAIRFRPCRPRYRRRTQVVGPCGGHRDRLRESKLRRHRRGRELARHFTRLHQRAHRRGQHHRSVEETLATLRSYAATNPLCADFDWDRERLILEGMAYSFINKFTDYTDRLPPDLYAVWQQRRGQGVLEPRLVYDRLHRLWHYPEAQEGAPKDAPDDAPNGDAKRQNGHTPRFQLVPFGYLRPGTDPGYLVDELIPLHGIVLVWGKRKCLKSFLMYDLCFHIARYSEYRDRMVQTGPVIYCAFEGAHGYNKRAEALRRHHKVPDSEEVPLYLVPGRANMIKEYPLLIAAVREQLAGEIPRTIVLDTLNKSLVGSESKDVDMAAYIVAAEALRDAFDCVVIVVHHCGYDETHPRGHTSLTGAVDAEFEVVREGMLVTLKNVTMRDGPEGFEIRSAAEVIEVGEDVHGKVLTSLVITPTDAPAMPGDRKKKGRPNAATPILILALQAALAERGSIFRPLEEKAAVHAANEDEVWSRFEIRYPAGEADKEMATKATRKAYQRALQVAVVDGVIRKGIRQGDVVLWFHVQPT